MGMTIRVHTLSIIPSKKQKGMKSLQAQQHRLANVHTQLEVLENGDGVDNFAPVPFQQKLEQSGLYPLTPVGLDILQINLGKMCNQVCKHCHVDAGPDRKEIMTRATMEQCLSILEQYPRFTTVDLTGGAPEMNPNFRWFVGAVRQINPQIHFIVRCNLTIIMANRQYQDLPAFYKTYGIEVVSSLPFYTQDRTDRQRGKGVFTDSIAALQLLNTAGYGVAGTGLVLNLVYNPAGAFLPPAQEALEKEYKAALKQEYGITFNQLFAITNLPISRYLDYLLQSGNYEAYMDKLTNAFNPAAAANVMCRNMLSIGWDGYIYDCDFNQMLDLKVQCAAAHIQNFDPAVLLSRQIVTGQHCYGCTAGAGSSCGGAVAS